MRVLRYIVRFLGISFIILWLLASFVIADDNVTVNFPDEMTVSGEVNIGNLGITQDVEYDTEPYPDPDVPVGGGGANNAFSYTKTYVSGYSTVTLWQAQTSFSNSNDVGGSLFEPQPIVISLPILNWSAILSDFWTVLFGNRFGSNQSLNPINHLPFLTGGRSNMAMSSDATLSNSVVTDFTGSGSWSFNVNWSSLWGTGNTENSFFYYFPYNTLRLHLSNILALLAWYEVVYSIFNKLSKA